MALCRTGNPRRVDVDSQPTVTSFQAAGRAPGLGPDAGDVPSGGAAPGQRRAARGAARLRAAPPVPVHGASGRAGGRPASSISASRHCGAIWPLRLTRDWRRHDGGAFLFVRAFLFTPQDSLAAAGHSRRRLAGSTWFVPVSRGRPCPTRHHAYSFPSCPAMRTARRCSVLPYRRASTSICGGEQAAAVPGAERLRSGAGAGGRGRGDRRFQRDPGHLKRYQGQARWLPEDARAAACSVGLGGCRIWPRDRTRRGWPRCSACPIPAAAQGAHPCCWP